MGRGNQIAVFCRGRLLPALLALPSLSISLSASALTAINASNGPALLYGALNLRHHINTFAAESSKGSLQEPSLHGRLQTGMLFYGGQVDLYTTLEVMKVPHSQQALLRRPQVALDYYPWRLPNFTLRNYHLLDLPFADGGSLDAEANLEATPYLPAEASGGTIYTMGIEPHLLVASGDWLGSWQLGLGWDGFTHLFSRRQFVHVNVSEVNASAAADTSEPREVEDYALRFTSRPYARLGFAPTAFAGLSGELHIYAETKFAPTYWPTEHGLAYRYRAARSSSLRLQLAMALSPRVTLVNEFYSYSEGFFAASPQAGPMRRYRNIAHLVCTL